MNYAPCFNPRLSYEFQMSKQHCIVTGMTHPFDEGSCEVFRRCRLTHDILDEVFGVRRIVKIEVGSSLHEICCRTLENKHMFRKHRKEIKKSIAKNMKHCSSNEFAAMGKHACFEIVLKDIVKQMMMDKHGMKSSAATRSKTKLIEGETKETFEFIKKNLV